MLLNMYIKELKDCFRDRRTLILTVLLPVIMMTGMTLFYENMISGGEGETYQLAVNESFDQGIEQIIAGFHNIELVKSEDPEATLQDGKAQAALILDGDFSAKIENGEKAIATIVADSFSQKSSSLNSIVQNALGIYGKSIIAERLQANGTDPSVVEPIAVEQREIADQNPNANLLAMLIPLILSIAIGVGSGPPASDLFAGEKEKKTMEALLMTPVKRSTVLFSKWLTIATVGSITGIVTMVVVALEISLLTENLKKAISLGDNAVAIVLLAVLVSVVYSMFTASLLMITSIIGKTVKESQSYSTPIMMLAIFPAMILAAIGTNELAFHHFAIPIMNLFSVLKELVFGIIDIEHILITLASNIVTIVLLFIAGRILFLKDKWVMN